MKPLCLFNLSCASRNPFAVGAIRVSAVRLTLFYRLLVLVWNGLRCHLASSSNPKVRRGTLARLHNSAAHFLLFESEQERGRMLVPALRRFCDIYRIRGTYPCKAKKGNAGSFSANWQLKSKAPTSCWSLRLLLSVCYLRKRSVSAPYPQSRTRLRGCSAFPRVTHTPPTVRLSSNSIERGGLARRSAHAV